MSWWSKKASQATSSAKKTPAAGACVDKTTDKYGRTWIADGPSPFPRRERGSSR